ncbi:MAG: PadR family transcriptional regulator [Candidatus Odinarchaeum yellowstonii]|uniref:PadR family transcriptional regulator n=1 Tax=Odinarchaeota yellowstonii (strain LCB_4) TaxID=1841599 RepID=A0AAF0IBM5_ODILC|nr:MAG: PadR family transcriptional regulator [Candidatus Odinarchaeum yellowstonii]
MSNEGEFIKAVQRLKSKLTKENLWLYILRLLQEKPRYGYEIREEIKKRFNFYPAIVSGYVIIYKMKRDNLVEERLEKDQSKRADRKYYCITNKGLAALKEAKIFLEDLMKKVFDLT